VSKTISEPIVRLTHTVLLYCTNTNTVSKHTEMRFHITHSSRSSIECVPHDSRADATFDTNRAPFLQCDYRYLQTNSNELPLEARHLRVSSGASKTISDPMVRLAQTAHLSCNVITAISKRTQTSFHLRLVTYEYRRVRPKQFLSL
jgi:hypothetical protein